MRLLLLDGTPMVLTEEITCLLQIAGDQNHVELFVSEMPCLLLCGQDLLQKYGLVFYLMHTSQEIRRLKLSFH